MGFNELVRKALVTISLFSIIYLVMVVSGAFTVLLSITIKYIELPRELFIGLQHHLSLFLALSMAYVFLSRPIGKGGKISWLDVLLAALSFSGPFYRFLEYYELSLRMGITTSFDIFFGVITVITIIEAVRRAGGSALMLVVLGFVLYTLWDVGADLKIFIERLYLYDVGIFSTPLVTAVTWISVFLFFGYFLDELGVSEFFIKLALSTVGHRRGGPAKTSVIGGALIGTTTGSAVGSSVLLSTFLGPGMKKFGYSAEEVAALLAAIGTGAQIMPPILGSAAFIMPLYLGVSYWTIAVASLVPALIYFSLLFIFTDLMAIKRGLFGLPKEELPRLNEVLKEIYLSLPIALIVILLAEGYDPQLAALASLIVALILGAFKSGKLTGIIGVAVAGGTFLIPMILFNLPVYAALFLSAGMLLPVSLAVGIMKGGRDLSRRVYNAIIRTMKDAASMVVICAGAGLIAGGISLTGLAYMLGRSIYTITAGNVILVGIITMAISIILGCAVPTPVVYVMTVSILGSLAYLLNIPPLVLHYFIFYYGIFAPLTPPVALAVMASASVTGADYIKSTIIASIMTASLWFVAWAFFFRPEMLVVVVSSWNLHNILMLALGIISSVVGSLALIVAYVGIFYGLGKINTATRIYYSLVVPALALYSAYSGNLTTMLAALGAFLIPYVVKVLSR